jgi:hypothetical protein
VLRHYELDILGRLFRSRAAFVNRTIWGGGGGAGAILPLIPAGPRGVARSVPALI